MARIEFKEYSDTERRTRIMRAYRRLHIVSTDSIIVAGIEFQENGDAGDGWVSYPSGTSHSLRQSQLTTPGGTIRPKNPD